MHLITCVTHGDCYVQTFLVYAVCMYQQIKDTINAQEREVYSGIKPDFLCPLCNSLPFLETYASSIQRSLTKGCESGKCLFVSDCEPG